MSTLHSTPPSPLDPSAPEPNPAVDTTLSAGLETEYGEQLRAQQQRYIAELEEQVNGVYPVTDDDEEESARTRANRANALLSTGPRTVEGKEISRHNAIRHGLTGRQVLLADEDADAYSALVEQFRADWSPATSRETELVQTLADTQWRLNRIPGLEMMVYAFGRVEYADLYADADPAFRAKFIDFHIYRAEAKELRNLALQENRLRRFYVRAEQELKALQSARKEREQARSRAAAAEDVLNTASPLFTYRSNSTDWLRFSDSPESPKTEAGSRDNSDVTLSDNPKKRI